MHHFDAKKVFSNYIKTMSHIFYKANNESIQRGIDPTPN